MRKTTLRSIKPRGTERWGDKMEKTCPGKAGSEIFDFKSRSFSIAESSSVYVNVDAEILTSDARREPFSKRIEKLGFSSVDFSGQGVWFAHTQCTARTNNECCRAS